MSYPTKLFVSELVQDTAIASPFLVTARSIRQTRHGEDFLCVTLMDRTGSIEARAWEHAQVLAARFREYDIVMTHATVTRYQDTLQLKVHDLNPLANEAVELTDYMPSSRWGPEALFAQLNQALGDQVTAQCEQIIENRYPFHPQASREAPLADFALENGHGFELLDYRVEGFFAPVVTDSCAVNGRC